MCLSDHEDVVGAAPTGDAPTTSEWSTIPYAYWGASYIRDFPVYLHCLQFFTFRSDRYWNDFFFAWKTEKSSWIPRALKGARQTETMGLVVFSQNAPASSTMGLTLTRWLLKEPDGQLQVISWCVYSVWKKIQFTLDRERSSTVRSIFSETHRTPVWDFSWVQGLGSISFIAVLCEVSCYKTSCYKWTRLCIMEICI